MILSFLQFLHLARKCPQEDIVLMSESEFNATAGEVTKDYWHRVDGQEGFFHSSTNEPLDLWPKVLVECMDPYEPIKRFVILGY